MTRSSWNRNKAHVLQLLIENFAGKLGSVGNAQTCIRRGALGGIPYVTPYILTRGFRDFLHSFKINT
jgi:hypothetical protein